MHSLKRASIPIARGRPRSGMLPSGYAKKRRQPDSSEAGIDPSRYSEDKNEGSLSLARVGPSPHDFRHVPARRSPWGGVSRCFYGSTLTLDYNGAATEGNKNFCWSSPVGALGSEFASLPVCQIQGVGWQSG
jgi:hypothetical protein